MKLLLRGLAILIVFELGVLLVMVPWQPRFWEYNGLLQRYPDLRPVMLNHFVRGIVSGLGVLDILIAASMVFSRPEQPAPRKSRQD